MGLNGSMHTTVVLWHNSGTVSNIVSDDGICAGISRTLQTKFLSCTGTVKLIWCESKLKMHT